MKFSEIKEHLGRFKVGIAGAGGLGSNCAVALARCGIGSLVICDYDVVEISNLNRQYYFANQTGKLKCDALRENIEKIDSNIVVEARNIILNPENIPVVFRECDIIVEAFDNSEAKEMIAETVQKAMPGVPLILGSGVAGWGNTDSVKCRKIDNTLYVCGDEETEVSDETPCIAPRVGIVANMQADTVISILLSGKYEHL